LGSAGLATLRQVPTQQFPYDSQSPGPG
jgi:hypothetical protein